MSIRSQFYLSIFLMLTNSAFAIWLIVELAINHHPEYLIGIAANMFAVGYHIAISSALAKLMKGK